MDAASCSVLRAQPFSSAVFPPSNNPTARFFALPKNDPNLVPSFSSTFPRNSTFPGKCLHFDRFAVFSWLSGAQDQNPSQELAVLLEVDGKSAGDEEKMKMAMDECLMSENLTLRPGVEEFVDDAYKKGIPVVVLTTYSKSGDQIARSIVEKLGEESISKLKIVGDKEVEQSLYTQLVNDTRLSSGVDEQLAKEAIKAGSQSGVAGAERVGMPCVVLRSR
ncbi:hypothetical protein DVH24_011125 [Malus domestica]|uniref:Uncharacterized protein n=1 Tax=Malus domestica TaxID=3750 RepID=A0A498JTK6_MALDO|nr:hypothetical protein DVH24_011125 [Malus domestica]